MFYINSLEIIPHRDSSDGSSGDDLTIDEEANICHICLFPMKENSALLQNDHVHAGVCQGCAERLVDMKVKCPICRADIMGILKVFL